jgi:large subunit ribosomal protein L29
VTRYERRDTKYEIRERHGVKTKEMREKTQDELAHLLSGWRAELFSLNVQSMTGQIEQYTRVREIRKNIARALTILRELNVSESAPAKEKGVS